MRRLRRLSEAECYLRCYGWSTRTVRVIPAPPRPVYEPRLSGEWLRRLFEERLNAREPDAA